MRTFLLLLLLFLGTMFSIQHTRADEKIANAAAAKAAADRELVFKQEIAPLLQKYCVRCHGSTKPKGEFDLTGYKSAAETRKGRDVWRKAWHVVKEEEMPPEDPLPTKAERQRLVDWLDTTTAIDWSKVKHPGHETIRRLTRDEYTNTTRDLFGIDLNAGEQLSQDGEGRSGFNTDRDALFVTPDQMEKYLAAAEKTVGTFVALKNGPRELHFESEKMFMTETKETPKEFGDDFTGYVLNRGQMTLYDTLEFPTDAIYEFIVRARSTAGRTGSRLRINDEFVGDIIVPDSEPGLFTIRAFVRKGTHQMAWNIEVPTAAQVPARLQSDKERPVQDPKAKPSESTSKTEIEPEQETEPNKKKARQKKTNQTPTPVEAPASTPQTKELPKNANELVTKFGMAHAPKLPVEDGYSDKAKALINRLNSACYAVQRPYEWLSLLGTDGDRSEIARFKRYVADRTKVVESAKDDVAKELKLSRADFDTLFAKHNAERDADNQKLLDAEFALDDFQMASRLSYFLWMSMPDDELFRLAKEGQLQKPDVLRTQVRRMLADPKSREFARAFTGQWLGFAGLGQSVSPDSGKFPQLTPALNEAMKLETFLSFQTIVQENRSLLELIDSKQTWLNESLAKHCGIAGVTGNAMQLVTLTDGNRGGVLGMGSVLTATSSATRTSPVIRGKWVLEILLGEKLPEPPSDAGELPGNAGEARTLRDELLMHRRNPACATCHNKIDPISFGLGNFDAIGRFRKQQANQPIDARGEFPDGTTFNGPSELKNYLVTKRRDEFIENVTRRAMSFALGCELNYFDEPAVKKAITEIHTAKLSSQSLIEAVVSSYPFQFQTGKPPQDLD